MSLVEALHGKATMAGVGAPWEAPWGLAREGRDEEGGGGEGDVAGGAAWGGGAMGRGRGAWPYWFSFSLYLEVL
jgi:hypothetical protein